MDVVLGIDINEYKAQVSYAATEEPMQVKTLALSSRGDGTLIETAISKRPGVNQWYYGMDALKKASNGQGLLVENIWQKLCRGEDAQLEGQTYDMSLLCNLFLKRIVSFAALKIQEELAAEVEIQAIVISADPFPMDLYEKIEQVTCGLLLDEKKVFWQGYEEALFSYLTHQPERMLGYETGVMDLSNEALVSYRIEMNHKAKPVVTLIKRMETSMLRRKHYPSIIEHDRALLELDAEFGEYIRQFTSGRLVTTFYLVGDGFEGNWCNESLKVLCRNRKVYAGNNLYSKGAVYSAIDKMTENGEDKPYIFLGKNMLLSNVGVTVRNGEKEEYCPLLDAGTNWYEAKCEMPFLLDVADQICLKITPVNGQKAYEEWISLEKLDQREGQTYRIRLSLSMQSQSLLEVQVEDEGFGELFPKSREKVQQLIELGG